MKTFRSERYEFAIDIPEDWSYSSPVGFLKRMFGIGKNQFNFKGPGLYHLHLLVGSLASFEKEPSPEDNKNYFQDYVSRHGYTDTDWGTIKIGDKDHFWGRYRMGEAGRLVKKYSIIIQRKEYVMTCFLGLESEEMRRKKEQIYDQVVSTFKLTFPPAQ